MMGGLLSGPFSPEQMTALIITLSAMTVGVVIAVTGIVFGTWQAIVKARAEMALKHEMIGRGMTADEIAQVLNARPGEPEAVRGAIDLPCACEAVVEADGEWHPGLVLQAADGRYLVHYVGTEMDENEWVDARRVRLPADSRLPGLLARLGTDYARNGALQKPPVEAEV